MFSMAVVVMFPAELYCWKSLDWWVLRRRRDPDHCHLASQNHENYY